MFQVYRKVIQLYIYIYIHIHTHAYVCVHMYTFFLRFFSIIGYYKILNIVPCTICRSLLFLYFIYSGVCLLGLPWWLTR